MMPNFYENSSFHFHTSILMLRKIDFLNNFINGNIVMVPLLVLLPREDGSLVI